MGSNDVLHPGTCDTNEETTAIARRYAEEAGVADRVDSRIGAVLETLETLDGPFPDVFIDADKAGYVDYHEAIPSCRPTASSAADNTRVRR
jgi:predicted O-methyltransferase YrrM